MEQPPLRLDPLVDKNNGFTSLSKLNEEIWRSAVVLNGRDRTTLQDFKEDTFAGRPAVKAYYKLGGYCCPVIAWFDLVTHERLD